MSTNDASKDCFVKRWVRRKEARPAEIVEAALQLFITKGFAATTLQDIARQAGVTAGTTYRYFASKEELFKEVVRSSLGAHLNEAERQIQAYQGDSAQLLRDALALWWQEVGASELSGLCKLMISEAGNFPELAHFYADEVVERGNRLLVLILQRGIDRGEFREVDVEYTAQVLIGPVLHCMVWKHSFACCGAAAMDMPRFWQAYFDLIFSGLMAGQEEA